MILNKVDLRLISIQSAFRREIDPYKQFYCFDLIGLALWHINHFRLFNAKSSLYI